MCRFINMKKYFIIAFLSVAIFAACKKTPEVHEKPFYPAVGAINARYSIGDNTTVVFAQGNLQYQASTGTWRFAENQYDIIGMSNELIDTTYSGWIDLFGWGTSGYNGLMPYTVTDSNAVYGSGESDIAGTHYDWGVHNPISNADNKPGVWRTMTYSEWQYLFSFRDEAGTKRGLATIENVSGEGSAIAGLLLLPDKWTLPAGCTFHYGSDKGFETNHYTFEEWGRMEVAGAVFLPVAGYRDVKKVSLIDEYGCYWASTFYDASTADELYIQNRGYGFSTAARSNGHSVRLVQER